MPTDDPDRDAPGPATPTIPSFGSLRGPRRRSPLDVLVPGEEVREAPAVEPRPVAPRPPEWFDLLRRGVRGAGAVVTAPVHLVRRLLGG